MGFLQVVRQPHLVMLWLSQFLSAIGDHLLYVALTWITVEQAGSSAAIIMAAGSMSALIFALLGGIFADRFDRRSTMIRIDLLRALMVGILPVLVLYGNVELWMLVVLMVIMGALGTFFDPALQASLPRLCGDVRTLQSMNALMDSTRRLARVMGPGLTGVILLVLALPDFFTLDAVSFVLSALLLFGLKRHFPPQELTERPQNTPSFFSEISVAIRLLRENSFLVWALTSLAFVNLAWSIAYQVGTPLFIQQVLHEQAGAFGLIGGAYGLGNVVSLLLFGGVFKRWNNRLMFIGQVILGIGFLVFSTSTSLSMTLLGVSIAAFGSPMGDLLILTMIQTAFPSEHAGKIYSIRMILGGSGLALGALLAIPLYKWVNIPVVIATCACFILVIGIAGMLRFREMV